MPAYKKKITRQMSYEEFITGIEDYQDTRGNSLPDDRKAFINVLYYAGCRVSEALALTSNDITCTSDTIYVDFFRLKGSKQTDPIPLPKNESLNWLCAQDGELFPWCRKTGYNIVHRVFAELYPHYFRANRVTWTLERFNVAVVKSNFGLSVSAIEHYVQKVDIGKVGKALKEEIG